ncbi:MAG: DUF2012 domain-containing protein [Anaerolineae bacterium]|nr:DUF2012 domain-containing protein [Anaerolineae bacterium]
MIDDLDEALRQLLIRELPIKNGEVDIQFKQPSREWSARLGRPTLNVYLYDLRENTKLRSPSPPWFTTQRNGDSVSQHRPAVRMDLQYVITAWANEPEDEHRLLSRALMALFRTPMVPEELLPESLRGQPAPIQVLAAQPNTLPEASLFWSALDNEIRPSIVCTITMAFDPSIHVETPVVRDRVLVFRNASTGATESPGRILWTVRGRISKLQRGANTRVTLLERDLDVPTQSDGSFVIRNVPEGSYTLEVVIDGEKKSRHVFNVPEREIVLEL